MVSRIRTINGREYHFHSSHIRKVNALKEAEKMRDKHGFDARVVDTLHVFVRKI